MDDCREAFEKWWIEQYPSDAKNTLKRNANGKYNYLSTNDHLRTWQAAFVSVDPRILVGGNHLASVLCAIAIPPTAIHGGYDEALERFGQPYADIWICWKAIMDAKYQNVIAQPTKGLGENK